MYLQTNLRAATRALTLLLDNAKKFTHDAEARLQHNTNGNLGEKKKVAPYKHEISMLRERTFNQNLMLDIIENN